RLSELTTPPAVFGGVRSGRGLVKFSESAALSGCELIRHCANTRMKTPVVAINTNIVFRTLSLSDFIVTPSSHQVLRVPLRSHRALSEQLALRVRSTMRSTGPRDSENGRRC